MDTETIRVWFCGRDKCFAEVLSGTLGPEFEVRQSDQLPAGANPFLPQFDAVLLDARHLSRELSQDILACMNSLKGADPIPPIIVLLLEDAERDLARRFIENGAYDTLTCPPDIAELRFVLRRVRRFFQVEKELAQTRRQERTNGRLGDLIGCTESSQQIFDLARKVASCDVSVLITGETGTGKELLARAIHQLSTRAAGPFVAFSCANLPENLADDELFGHEKGAFTGAIAARRGRFEAAEHGTLFLDEIGDLAFNLQAKLLRALQQRSYERIGSCSPVNADVRVVCATHRNLEQMVQDGQFRMDLYFRLNVVQLQVPALRERREDIPILAQHFLRKYVQQFGKRIRSISPSAMHALEEHAWPGNVRELENVIQRAVVMAEGNSIEAWHLPKALSQGFEQAVTSCIYEDEIREFKRRLILRALRESNGKKVEAARTLGVARGYLHRLINQLDIHLSEEDEDFAAVESECEPPSKQAYLGA